MKQETTTEGAVNPVKSLASLYAEKKPKKPSVAQQAGQGFMNALGGVLSFPATIIDAYDWANQQLEKYVAGTEPKDQFDPASVNSVNLLSSGGRALESVTGDTTNLGKYVLTGNEKYWQQMPAVKANEAAGGGFLGALAAAAPYLELGGYAAPIAGSALREAGMLAPKVVPYKPLTLKEVPATAPTTPYRTTRAALAEDMVQKERPIGEATANDPSGRFISPSRPRFIEQPKPEMSAEDIAAASRQRMDRELQKALTEGVGSTSRAADYEKTFANQIQTSLPTTNWSTANLMNERDINLQLFDPMDILMLPEPLRLKAQAQQAFRAELLPFLERRGLMEEFVTGFPFLDTWGNPERIARVEVLYSLFERLPQTKDLYVDTMRSYGIGDVSAPRKVVSGRVAPGFVTSEPVLVGNVGKLPSGATIELATPEQSVAFVAEQGSLDQVPTEHLWQTITENSGPGKRFEQIGGGGGAYGMDRFRDTVTGQQMGLKHVPGEQDLVANGFIAPTFFETLSDDVGSAVGIPRMGVRTVVNSDGSVSLVTELAQSVYDGEIMDSFQAMTKSRDGAPALGNRVTVNSRIRKALLDDLLENADVHDGNQLFVVNNDGTVDIIPIDLEYTFGSIQWVLNPKNRVSKVFSVDDVRQISWGQFSDVDRNGVENWSLRNRIVQDTDNLRDEIQAVIETVQQQLSVDNLQREMKLRIDEIGRSYQRVAGANPANLDKFLKQASQTVELFMTRIGDFLDTPAKTIADAYIKAIEAGVFA